MDGVVDLGIIGENVLEEELLSRRAQGEDPRYFTLRRLDFGGCRLSLATPVDEAWNGPAALDGKRIADNAEVDNTVHHQARDIVITHAQNVDWHIFRQRNQTLGVQIDFNPAAAE